MLEPSAPKQCRVQACLPKPSVLAVRIEGHLEPSPARELADSLLALFPPTGSVHLYIDASELRTYSNEARSVLINAFRARLRQIEGITVVTSSVFVRMGATVANMALDGTVHICEEPVEFDRRLAHALGLTRPFEWPPPTGEAAV